MPSSLTRFLSRALVRLRTLPPVSVLVRPPTGSAVRFSRRDGPLGAGSRGNPSATRLTRAAASIRSSRQLPSAHSRGIDSCRRRGNVDPLSIGYAFRPGLRCRLTPGGRTCPGKPWDSGDRDSHPVFRYSCPHNRRQALQRCSRTRLRAPAALPYHLSLIRRFGTTLDSRSFSARDLSTSQLLRTVQMVAASGPTSWLSSKPHILSDLASFWGLIGRSGLFPSRPRSLAPAVSLPGWRFRHSEFERLRYPGRGPRPFSALPPEGAVPKAAPKGISGRTSYHPV